VNVVFTLLALAVSLRVSREAAGQAQSATNG